MIVAAFKDVNHRCSITSGGASGANDLAVTFVRFNAAGALFDGRFQVLVVE